MESIVDALIDSFRTISEACLLQSCGTSTTANSDTSLACQRQPCEKLTCEQNLLSQFLPELKNSKHASKASKLATLLELLIEKRVKVLAFMQGLRHKHVHSILILLRFLLKQTAAVGQCKHLLQEEFVSYLISMGETYSELYLDSAFQSQKMFDLLLVEVLFILSRMATNDGLNDAIVMSQNNVLSVMSLCSSIIVPTNKNTLLRYSLKLILDCITNSSKAGHLVYSQIVSCCGGVNILAQVLQILNMPSNATQTQPLLSPSPQSNEDDFAPVQFICSDICFAFCDLPNCPERTEFAKIVAVVDAVPVLLSKLNLENLDLCFNCSWSLAKLAVFSDAVCNAIVNHHFHTQPHAVVKFILEFLISQPTVTKSTDTSCNYGKFLSCKTAVCSTLARVARSSEYSEKILVEANSIYILAKLIFSTNFGLKECKKETLTMVAYALMVLRILFSSKEKYRAMIRNFFPGQLCGQFADCGNYNLNFKCFYKLAAEMMSQIGSGGLDVSAVDLQLEEANMEKRRGHEEKETVIGKYVVVDSIGDGSFGSVFKVRRKSQTLADSFGGGAFYALKKISYQEKETESKRKVTAATINNESKILQEKLDHPNLVRYLKKFRENENLYVLMEFVDGDSLQNHLEYVANSKTGPIPEHRVWNISIQIIQGLKYLHVEKGLVHRDLSPNNILLTYEDVVKIADFGFTRQTDQNGVCTSVVGTVSYWCPEITQKKPYDGRADIWAFGCVVYQMCTLCAPFVATNILSIAKKIVECDYTPIPSNLPYSAPLRQVVTECITVDKDKRPDALGVIQLMAPKLLDQLNSQAEKLKQYKRKTDLLREKLEVSRRSLKFHSSQLNGFSDYTSESHNRVPDGDRNSLTVGVPYISTPSPGSDFPSDISSAFNLGSSHSRASSATSLGSVAEEYTLGNSGSLNSRNTLQVLAQSQGSGDSAQTRSTKCRSLTRGSSGSRCTVVVPASRLKELKFDSNTAAAFRSPSDCGLQSEEASLADTLGFLRKLEAACNKYQNGVSQRVKSYLLVALVKKRLYESQDESWMGREVSKFLRRSTESLDHSFWVSAESNTPELDRNFSCLANSFSRSERDNRDKFLPSDFSEAAPSISYLDVMAIVDSLSR